MRGIAPAAFRLRGGVGLAYAPASQSREATRVRDLFTGAEASSLKSVAPSLDQSVPCAWPRTPRAEPRA